MTILSTFTGTSPRYSDAEGYRQTAVMDVIETSSTHVLPNGKLPLAPPI